MPLVAATTHITNKAAITSQASRAAKKLMGAHGSRAGAEIKHSLLPSKCEWRMANGEW